VCPEQQASSKLYFFGWIGEISAGNGPKAGHGGMTKTLEILRRQFYWPGMTIQVRE